MRVDPYFVSKLVPALDGTQARQEELTSQLASGVRVTSLSTDPVAAGVNVLLLDRIQQDDSFRSTSDLVSSQLQVADSVLGQVVTQLTTAIGLATGANNGTLNESNLQTISNQIASIAAEVTALANTNYLGRYIFAGGQNANQPFVTTYASTPAQTNYVGDNNVNYLTTPSGQSIQLNVPGGQIFTAATANVFEALNNLVADYATGTATERAVRDTQALGAALNYVSQQRVTIDNSITRLSAATDAVINEQTQLLSSQTDLMQADVAEVATQLSLAASQQTALMSVIAQLGSKSLFEKL